MTVHFTFSKLIQVISFLYFLVYAWLMLRYHLTAKHLLARLVCFTHASLIRQVRIMFKWCSHCRDSSPTKRQYFGWGHSSTHSRQHGWLAVGWGFRLDNWFFCIEHAYKIPKKKHVDGFVGVGFSSKDLSVKSVVYCKGINYHGKDLKWCVCPVHWCCRAFGS